VLIDTSLLVNSLEIIHGLLDGSMTRYGSVIRWSAGTEKAGQVVRHLAETPGLTKKLTDMSFSPLIGGIDMIDGYSNLIGIEKTLSSVMGLTQIAAGASVLNLGFSIAGFAYMGFKLHQIQDSLNHLQNRLDIISGQLAYLYLLVEGNLQQQKRLAQAVSHIQQAIIIKEIAALNAELNDRKRFPYESPRDSIKVADRVRLFLGNQALQVTPQLDAELMLNTDIAIQGWAVATATEANLLLEIGQYQEAGELLALEVPKFKQVAEKWASELISDDNSYLSTAYRFSHTRFQKHITPERVKRIAAISPKDYTLSSEEIRHNKINIDVEFQMFHSSQWDEKWIHRQIAIAEYLDTLSELLAKLDSLQSFANLCESRNIKSSRDILPSSDTEIRLHLLSAN